MTTETSKRALAQVDKKQWYGRIRAVMSRKPHRTWCISEVAYVLNEQKSSVSPRLNEMRAYGWIRKAGERPSNITGITSMVYELK